MFTLLLGGQRQGASGCRKDRDDKLQVSHNINVESKNYCFESHSTGFSNLCDNTLFLITEDVFSYKTLHIFVYYAVEAYCHLTVI